MKDTYKWDLVEPYLDKEIKSGDRNRKLKFPTFREFKKMAQDGMTVKKMASDGYSLHFLRFLYHFSTGKINISKETLEKDHIDKTLDDMCVEYSITRADMACLRQLYDIDIISPAFRKRVKNENPLTDDQISILYGSMLGDAGKKSERRIKFVHSYHQKEYIFWLHEKFSNLSGKMSSKIMTSSITKKKSTIYGFSTKSHSEIENCNNIFYRTGKKEVHKEILEFLSPLALAVWMMDDGSCDWNERGRRKRKHVNFSPVFYFSTDGFSFDSCVLLRDFLLSKYNISTRIRIRDRNDKKYNIIYVDNKSNNDFVSLIKPYILPCLLRKIDYQEYSKWLLEKDQKYSEYLSSISSL